VKLRVPGGAFTARDDGERGVRQGKTRGAASFFKLIRSYFNRFLPLRPAGEEIFF
jgi:hypothetical protein